MDITSWSLHSMRLPMLMEVRLSSISFTKNGRCSRRSSVACKQQKLRHRDNWPEPFRLQTYGGQAHRFDQSRTLLHGFEHSLGNRLGRFERPSWWLRSIARRAGNVDQPIKIRGPRIGQVPQTAFWKVAAHSGRMTRHSETDPLTIFEHFHKLPSNRTDE